MLRLKLYLVYLMGDARYHVAIVPNEWLSAYLNTLICVVFLSLEASSHKLYIFITLKNIAFYGLTIEEVLEIQCVVMKRMGLPRCKNLTMFSLLCELLFWSRLLFPTFRCLCFTSVSWVWQVFTPRLNKEKFNQFSVKLIPKKKMKKRILW